MPVAGAAPAPPGPRRCGPTSRWPCSGCGWFIDLARWNESDLGYALVRARVLARAGAAQERPPRLRRPTGLGRGPRRGWRCAGGPEPPRTTRKASPSTLSPARNAAVRAP